MQTYILLHKSSHETEGSGFTMEWKSWTKMTSHSLNMLVLFTAKQIGIRVKVEMLVLQSIPESEIEVTFNWS